jgi:hypothetical protein
MRRRSNACRCSSRSKRRVVYARTPPAASSNNAGGTTNGSSPSVAACTPRWIRSASAAEKIESRHENRIMLIETRKSRIAGAVAIARGNSSSGTTFAIGMITNAAPINVSSAPAKSHGTAGWNLRLNHVALKTVMNTTQPSNTNVVKKMRPKTIRWIVPPSRTISEKNAVRQ